MAEYPGVPESGTYQVTFTPLGGGTLNLYAGWDTGWYWGLGEFCHVQGYAEVQTATGATGDVVVSLPFPAASAPEASEYVSGALHLRNLPVDAACIQVGAYLEEPGQARFKIAQMRNNTSILRLQGEAFRAESGIAWAFGYRRVVP